MPLSALFPACCACTPVPYVMFPRSVARVTLAVQASYSSITKAWERDPVMATSTPLLIPPVTVTVIASVSAQRLLSNTARCGVKNALWICDCAASIREKLSCLRVANQHVLPLEFRDFFSSLFFVCLWVRQGTGQSLLFITITTTINPHHRTGVRRRL